MLRGATPCGHHMFLLETPPRAFARVVQTTPLRYLMTDRPTGFVVAVVDDDQSILCSLEYLLDSADYTVRLFQSAAELLESSDLNRIDCLISDVDMPGTDGFELLRLIHAVRPKMPTILITGYPERLERMPSVGDKPRLFTKPFEADELLAALSDGLRNFPR